MLADMISVIVKMLPVFLQTGPAHSVDNGERPVFARRDGIADGYIVEINGFVHTQTSRFYSLLAALGILASFGAHSVSLRICSLCSPSLGAGLSLVPRTLAIAP